jgi:hypothetical protein
MEFLTLQDTGLSEGAGYLLCNSGFIDFVQGSAIILALRHFFLISLITINSYSMQTLYLSMFYRKEAMNR